MTQMEMRKLVVNKTETSDRPGELRVGLNTKLVSYAGFQGGDEVYVVHQPGLMVITKKIKDVKV